MNIVVLAGGLSMERDVSIITGKMVTKPLRENGHNVVLLDLFSGYNGNNLANIFETNFDFTEKYQKVNENLPNINDIKKETNTNETLGKNVINICKKADIVFMALHGDIGENGKLQAMFDILGIKYTGSDYLSSAIAMNKHLSKKLFANSCIPTPYGKLFTKQDNIEQWNTFPCVVKPCCGGSSVGVSIVNNSEELIGAVSEAFRYEDSILIEKYIKGKELSVGIIGKTILPIIEIRPKNGFYDYKNKYQVGLTEDLCPAPLPENISEIVKEYAQKAYNSLSLNTYARIDFILDDNNNIFCLEANTLPGMTPTSLLPQEALAIGINYNSLVEMIINESLRKYLST
jgi:D-alanine-D-alanine ligase